MTEGSSSVETVSDRLLDVTAVGLATWTAVYHLCLAARLGTTVAVVLEALLLLGAAALLLRHPHRTVLVDAREPAAPATRAPGPRRFLVPVLLASAFVAALGTALDAPWAVVWIGWLAAAATGCWWAWSRRDPSPAGAPEPAGPPSGWTAAVVLAWAVGLGVLSVWALRPNPDDLFYVNLSQWVASHGSFPIRDTIFSDLRYPMANWPPVASYDGLVGTLARLTGARAAGVEYQLVPPVATFLAVLALWRLLRAWRVRHVALVLSVAMVFLLFDGTSSYGSPGNLFVTRLWQGKVILLCLLVPLLLTWALAYVERPTRRNAVWLAVGGAASVALSTTAIFLVPLVALAGMAPLVRRPGGGTRRALGGFAAMAAYPLAAGVATLALGGRSADDFGARRQYRFDGSFIGHAVFLDGVVALLGVAAVLLGVLLVPHRDARVTTGLLVLATGVVLIPGVTRLSYDVIGLGPTLWRVSWGLTLAALVGLGAVRLGRLVPRRWGPAAAAAVVAVLLVTLAPPSLGRATGTRLTAPWHWQRSDASRTAAAAVLAGSEPGDVVLAPDDLSITITITQTEVKTVAPRDYYMDYLRDVASFHYRDRLTLVHFVDREGRWDAARVDAALRVVGVRTACVYDEEPDRVAALRSAGFRPLVRTSSFTCLRRM